MTPFRFRLERVLEIRRMEADRERSLVDQMLAALAELADRDRTLVATRDQAAGDLRTPNALIPLHAIESLDDYRQYVQEQRARLAQVRAHVERQLAAQRARLVEAQRKVKLLEKLRERRQEDWKAAFAKELDELASESYMNRFSKS